MRRLSLHRAEPKIDAGFAKISRQQLRMGVGDMQDTRIAEAFEIINACVVGTVRATRCSARKRHGARESEKITAANGHAILNPIVFRASSRLLFHLLPARS